MTPPEAYVFVPHEDMDEDYYPSAWIRLTADGQNGYAKWLMVCDEGSKVEERSFNAGIFDSNVWSRA